jgi:glutamyl-tRNA synthetase
VNTVRVRFAPSPTGHLHIGGLRTALFNWLFARHHKGVFLLRIEDTDIQRSHATYVDSILSALQWANLASDEPLVYQSQRFDIYRAIAHRLITEGKAYKCYCPPTAEKIGEEYFKYDGRCRAALAADDSRPYVIRFKFSLEREVVAFNDLIRGPISFPADQFDDFIIVRTDGTPTYNFVVVVDDIDMRITHIIRGEDHISNTPKQVLLYEALQGKCPEFAHVSMILGPTGQRLSKRDGATSVIEYKEQGYLPDALCNYLVRLGWAHGDQEIFTRDELIQLFSLDNISKSGAIFDPNKLNWLNGMYMRETESATLLDIIVNDVDSEFLRIVTGWSSHQMIGLITLYKERVSTVGQLREELVALYTHQKPPVDADVAQWVTEKTPAYLQRVVEQLNTLDDFTTEHIQPALKGFCKANGIKLTEIAQPLRIALTGSASGPGVFDLLSLLGKSESIRRIQGFLTLLAA